MNELFNFLNHAIEGNPIFAICAAIAWGILSILLSPCHLASIPLIVGFIDNQGKTTTKRAFLTSLLFAFGILLTIGIVGIITALAGKMMGDVGALGNYIVAGVFFLVGLHLLEIISIPFTGADQSNIKKKGFIGAFILGLVFGIALGPCTFAYMAPMLAITFSTSADNAIYGAVLLLAYGVGHCSVIVLAGTSTELVQKYLNWNKNSNGANILKTVCAILILFAGLYFIYTAPTENNKTVQEEVKINKNLPTIMDFGMESCVQCKMMKVVLDDLKIKCKDSLNIKYINIRETPKIGEKYKVQQIPLQIFYDKKGKELYRHTGFISAEDIVAKFAEFKIDIKSDGEFAEVAKPAEIAKVEKPKVKEDYNWDFTGRNLPKNYTGVIFYMFHSDDQCPCNSTISILSYATLDENFKQELNSKQIIYKEMNVEDEEGVNDHFIDDYELEPAYHLHNGAVIVKMTNGKRGKWKKLEEVDDLKDDDDEFIKYATSEIKKFIK